MALMMDLLINSNQRQMISMKETKNQNPCSKNLSQGLSLVSTVKCHPQVELLFNLLSVMKTFTLRINSQTWMMKVRVKPIYTVLSTHQKCLRISMMTL